jgi:DNA replication and repair protein RecF
MDTIGEVPSVQYKTIDSIPESAGIEEIQEIFGSVQQDAALREQEQGRTLPGPHRDELVFRLNDFELRRYASQGQHRTFGVSLKLAKYLYLRDHTGTEPVLLLDDVFGNLDRSRSEVFFNLLQSGFAGQSIITGADTAPFSEFVPFDEDDHQIITVNQGSVYSPAACVD